jgi:hypothetical protein
MHDAGAAERSIWRAGQIVRTAACCTNCDKTAIISVGCPIIGLCCRRQSVRDNWRRRGQEFQTPHSRKESSRKRALTLRHVPTNKVWTR